MDAQTAEMVERSVTAAASTALTSPSTLPAEARWRERRQCVDVDPLTFFPEDDDLAGIAAAKDVCRGCPVLIECAAAGAREAGVWGGMTEHERGQRRRHRPAPVAAFLRCECGRCDTCRRRRYPRKKRGGS